MKNGAHYQYKKRQIEGEEQGKLIIMLYDGTIKFLNFAKAAIANKDMEAAHNNLIRGQALITELMNSLKVDVGEIAINLLRLYEFMNRQLCLANSKKDPVLVDGVIELLTSLRSGWIDVIKKLKETPRDESALAGKGEEEKEVKKNPIDIAI